ncbi:MAG: BON domain-containing protein [Planctomycetales bacterium]|nr:BON domain-containing protein [Planctomycetales bacterium]MBN8627189.1 BON domain-containing protein [Planctomycetota bacterium]
MSLTLSRNVTDDNYLLASEVSAAMRERLGRKAAKLEVVARDGLVTLRGVLASFYDKQLSLHAAKRVTGVSALRDELQVVSNP